MNKVLKRFYKEAAVGSADGGFTVLLDGKPVRTPKGHRLVMATEGLARAVADEWAEQGEKIDPDAMPMMQLAATALDRVAPDRLTMRDNLLRYAETDLLCYRAAHPSDLVKKQSELWQPVVDWAALHLDAPLKVTDGLAPVPQPQESLASLSAHLAALDDWRFTVVSVATSATGSLLLGLALVKGHLTADGLIAASQLDEEHQRLLWGEDEEATQRLNALADEIIAAERFLACLP
jgi:chaperone required for assembly of F1-ATPase